MYNDNDNNSEMETQSVTDETPGLKSWPPRSNDNPSAASGLFVGCLNSNHSLGAECKNDRFKIARLEVVDGRL